ncbi:hypothetical protein LOTGIDRAFT_154173 [Lottia gigantea]|uniref:Fibronectin type-III domain-containing protein n=1 Tax=Lottia gigantea TaxID=225164 RepID=V3ZDA6_LOTGI|nr:hypothetical protein LOTGIDRAFT_154173 [Lottia gigantea]ESO89093.1 hypothetical protein LOTGIDRAFT_154173 [Lottia gigantea]
MDTLPLIIYISILIKTAESLVGSKCKLPTNSCNMEGKSGFTCKSGVCVCDADYYSIEENCERKDDLKPKNISISDITSSSFKLSWIEKIVNSTMRYLILSNKINRTINNGSITSITINGLTPSTQYTNITVEAEIRTRSGTLTVSSEGVTVLTEKEVSSVIPITVAVVLSVLGIFTYILKSVYDRFFSKRLKIVFWNLLLPETKYKGKEVSWEGGCCHNARRIVHHEASRGITLDLKWRIDGFENQNIPVYNIDSNKTTPVYNIDSNKTTPVYNIDSNKTTPVYNIESNKTIPVYNIDSNNTTPVYNIDGNKTIPVYNIDSNKTTPVYNIDSNKTTPVYNIDSNKTTPVYNIDSNKTTPVYNIDSNKTTPVYNIDSNKTTTVYNIDSNKTTPVYNIDSNKTTPVYNIGSNKTTPVYNIDSNKTTPVCRHDKTTPIYNIDSNKTTPVYNIDGNKTIIPVYNIDSNKTIIPVYNIDSNKSASV